MQSEMQKLQPDRDILGESLKRTCAVRREFCQRQSTADVLKEYPALQIRVLVRFI